MKKRFTEEQIIAALKRVESGTDVKNPVAPFAHLSLQRRSSIHLSGLVNLSAG
jgi:hypothetical protein